MSWTDVAWSINAGVCLTLAAVHLLMWLHDRNAQANLAFSIWVTAVAISALIELAMLHSSTHEIYAELLEKTALPYAVMTIAYITFIRLYLQAGRWWLFWSVIGLSVLELLVKLTVLPTFPFAEITDLRYIPLWGEKLADPTGTHSSGSWLTGLLMLSLIAFIGNAAVEAWRGNRHRRVKIVAVAFCSSTVFAIAISAFVLIAELPLPIVVTPPAMITILVMAYGLSSDLLQARQLARELRETQARMSLATSGVDLGVWDWDAERDEVWATDNILQRFALDDHERLNLSRFLEKMHPADSEEIQQQLRSGFGNQKDFELEYRMIAANNEVRWIETRGRIERDANGKLLRVSGVSNDITAHKQDEAEKTELRRELAQYNRIMQMNELSASLAHEINQPLGTILNNAATAQILYSKGEQNDERIVQLLQFIIEDTERASEVIRNTRSILHKGDVNFELLSVNAIIEEIITLLQNNLSKAQVSLAMNLQPELAQVSASRIGLQQVLINLITNALDAMRDSTSKILTISSNMSLPDMVTVCVSDSGTGIDESLSGKIFAPFFTTKKDGMGMGLRISRSIIEEHDGKIWFENNPEGGARVCISIPVYQGDK